MPGQILPDVWGSFRSGHEWGAEEGGRIRNARAYRDGGLDAVADAAGRTGDLETMEGARTMTRRQRMFEDDQRQGAYERMETIRPLALGALDRVSQLPFEQRAAWLNQPHIRQRFLDFGFSPEQYDAGAAMIANPETGEAALEELRAAFTQHQNPDWQINEGTGQVYAVDPNSGQVQEGGQIDVAPEWQTNGTTPYRITPDGQVIQGQGQIPRVPTGYGGGGVQYRPASPEDAQVYGLPNEGHGYVIGSNGRPMAATSGGGVFPADQRARVAIMYEPALEASRFLESADASAVTRRGNHVSDTPLGQDWLARGADAIPLVGDALASNLGGDDYQRYVSASSTFESSMLPILSGAAVTPSEATRIIRAALPRIGDSQEVLADKARRRRQMLNGAALIGGRSAPFPADGVPDWARRAQEAGQTIMEGGADGQYEDGISPGQYPPNYDPNDVSTWPDWALEGG